MNFDLSDRKALGFLLVLLFAVLVVWHPVLTFQFVWDDYEFLANEPYFHNLPLFIETILSPFYVSQNYFRPLPLIALYLLGGNGADPMPYHGLLLFIHVANSILLFSLISCLVTGTRKYFIALFGALLFALNPSASEVVPWISGVFDAMFATFAVSLLLADTVMRSPLRRFFVITLLFLLAALTKEMAAGFVLLLPAWHIFLMLMNDKQSFSSEDLNKLKVTYAACFVGGVIYLGIRYAALGYLYVDDGSESNNGEVFVRLGLIFKSIGFYVLHSAYPLWDVSPVYPTDPLQVFGVASDVVYFAFGGFSLIVIFILAVKKSWRSLAGVCAFLFALFPVLHIIPLPIGDNFAHLRFLYFPLIIFSILVSVAVARCEALSQKHLLYLSGLVLVVFSLVTSSIIPFWQSNITLWSWAKEVRPESSTAKANYFSALADAGQCELVVDSVRAEVLTSSDFLTATMANCYAALGDVDRAGYYYEQVLSDAHVIGFHGPDRRLSKLYSNMAAMYLEYRPEDEQIAPLLDLALNIEPQNYSALFLKGCYLLEVNAENNQEAAIELILEAFSLNPDAEQREMWRNHVQAKFNLAV